LEKERSAKTTTIELNYDNVFISIISFIWAIFVVLIFTSFIFGAVAFFSESFFASIFCLIVGTVFLIAAFPAKWLDELKKMLLMLFILFGAYWRF
jgi:hypothetical protein